MVKRMFLVAVLLATLSTAALLAEPETQARNLPDSDPMPDVLWPDSGSRPIWVAADRALTSAGEIDMELFSPTRAETLQMYLETDETSTSRRCAEIGTDEEIWVPERKSIQAAVQHSEHVFVGLVTGTSPGFKGAVAGTLLRVRPEEFFKGQAHYGAEYYFFIPVGEIRLGTKNLCAVNRDYPDHRPQPGDSALIMADWWDDRSQYQEFGGSTGLIVIRENGSLSLPRSYRDSDHNLSEAKKDRLHEVVRSALVGGEK